MNLENIIELIYTEYVLESMGMLFGLFIFWQVFFQQELSILFSLFITSIS